jgi:4-cresol dehydrogenase (hydroxylating)
VDLSGLNRILDLDPELGYVRIEAGVTQGQLYRFLRENKLRLWMDATGAGPNASIVGNTLDRGFGHTRYGDRSIYNCGMTVVLPNGEVVKTGFGHFPHAKADKAYRNGVGPSIDGLFFQSNLGIVTEMGLWLMPEPEAYSAFFFNAQSEDDIQEIIERLAPLKRQGLLPSAIHIANDLRLISNRARYPWLATKGATPLPPEQRRALRGEYQIHAWLGCGAIYGTKGIVRETEKILKKELRRFKPIFLNEKKFALAEKVQRVLSWFGLGETLKQKIESARPVFELICGIPSEGAVHSGEWRVKNLEPGDEHKQPEKDPLDSDAGLIWISPVLPMTPKAVVEVRDLLDRGFRKHGFDTLLTFTMITDRALCCVSNIAYDRRDPADVARAKACYSELYDTLIEAGYIPYRSGPSGFGKLSQSPSTFWDFTVQLKHSIDPNNILSPGRYIPDRP